MWIADGWKDYELLDCGGGEKLERWGDQILVRPDPQAIWESDRKNRGWRTANARYSRSSTGGGHWDKNKLPESWPIAYKNLRFQVKPMNFKHTGLFPEQAANWDFAMDQIRRAGRPIRVLNLFAYTGGATVACAAAGASVCHVDAAKGMVAWAKENGIANGDSRGDFKPDQPVTRQELAAFLTRYDQYRGVPLAEGSLNLYSDANMTGVWAVESMRHAVGMGWLDGDGGRLLPGGVATRAQLAVILQRLTTQAMG